eukprot:1752774-Amphidinium_carterae.1
MSQAVKGRAAPVQVAGSLHGPRKLCQATAKTIHGAWFWSESVSNALDPMRWSGTLHAAAEFLERVTLRSDMGRTVLQDTIHGMIALANSVVAKTAEVRSTASLKEFLKSLLSQDK